MILYVAKADLVLSWWYSWS